MLDTVFRGYWQRCFACDRVVAKDGGCNHITCTFGHQFCWLCGAKWKTCRYPTVDEAFDVGSEWYNGEHDQEHGDGDDGEHNGEFDDWSDDRGEGPVSAPAPPDEPDAAWAREFHACKHDSVNW